MIQDYGFLDEYLVDPKVLVAHGQCYSQLRKFAIKLFGPSLQLESKTFYPTMRRTRIPADRLVETEEFANEFLTKVLVIHGGMTEQQASEELSIFHANNLTSWIGIVEDFKWKTALIVKASNAYVHSFLLEVTPMELWPRIATTGNFYQRLIEFMPAIGLRNCKT